MAAAVDAAALPEAEEGAVYRIGALLQLDRDAPPALEGDLSGENLPGEPTLRPPGLAPFGSDEPEPVAISDTIAYVFDEPSGFTGRSGLLPRDVQTRPDFVPVEDRWRLGFPEWDRYGEGHPATKDYPYALGRLLDPYRQNVLKGDYPILGQHTFLNLTVSSQTLLEYRQVPTPTTPFESTGDPFQEEFFGNPNQFLAVQNFRVSVDLFHGDGAFKPIDWRLKITQVFNANYLETEELAVVSPNVLDGKTRYRGRYALEEWFYEHKLADLSPDYDFISARIGSQPFASDFRGFIFADTNRAIRLFGTSRAQRNQFNVIWFDQTEKDTNSFLNTYDDRHQNTVIANFIRQDCIWPGYTALFSLHYNHDRASFLLDKNGFLVRPDPVGIFQPHPIEVGYLGWAGDGHINRVNISHAMYYAYGIDNLNPLAGREIEIDAWMGALELSYDRDWVRFRGSLFYASGDDDINDGKGEGFDAIFDNPNFAGGQFSYWQRQTIKLLGTNLTNRNSLLADLRASKFQGQPNFVNPGVFLTNLGMDFDLTPKFRVITNVNMLWFNETQVLEQFVFQQRVRYAIGTDFSTGIEYRPRLNNNAILVGGVSCLTPRAGFYDLFTPLVGHVTPMWAAFADFTLTY